jgi:hypothetical protein
MTALCTCYGNFLASCEEMKPGDFTHNHSVMSVMGILRQPCRKIANQRKQSPPKKT